MNNKDKNKRSKMKITKKQILNYVKKAGFTNPTNREILRTVPPGLQDDARNGKVWIGRCDVYGCKMHYSVDDIKHFIKKGL
tara:strand:- start:23 stop:265 length:243 start_codon:yes stop_codon:yes gene_type:complete